MQVGEVCSRDVYVVRADEPLAEAAKEMCSRHVGSVVIVAVDGDSVRPVGILTDRDIVRGQFERKADLFCLTAGDVMTPDPLTLREDMDVAEAIPCLGARGVRRAPVVNDEGILVGIVTFDDLLPAVAESLAALAALIGTQARRELRS